MARYSGTPRAWPKPRRWSPRGRMRRSGTTEPACGVGQRPSGSSVCGRPWTTLKFARHSGHGTGSQPEQRDCSAPDAIRRESRSRRAGGQRRRCRGRGRPVSALAHRALTWLWSLAVSSRRAPPVARTPRRQGTPRALARTMNTACSPRSHTSSGVSASSCSRLKRSAALGHPVVHSGGRPAAPRVHGSASRRYVSRPTVATLNQRGQASSPGRPTITQQVSERLDEALAPAAAGDDGVAVTAC